LIVVAGLAATHRHDALRVHITRLLDMGTERVAIAHALVACLGAATTLSETVDGLGVLSDCVDEHGRSSESRS
jgi:alkylhydroperoxidase/carboxymuconolactone decarboxylase family protein YurZ